ncbi:TonB-dependent siderophore receptor [Pseudomonas schmalbachii]|uniref:TonB-dependent siderophore receptor n=1 Tax=Pseudomonas schmalbachii TaxID=2816993 RepID=A0ABS3TTV5_9PSED|nr:TonB-dependent siderophore receptor [Pseudomonas schmalbachii]MBO3277092.1 TonB-dependent siderophore receptor [Pseudomonas schmalbachii]
MLSLRHVRLPLSPLALALGLSCMLAGPVAQAAEVSQQQVRAYAIPAAPLADVLSRIANDAGLILAIDPRLVGNELSNPVNGQYTPEQAMQQALSGHRLQLQRSDDGTYRLIPADTLSMEASTVTASVDDDSVGYVPRRSRTGTKTDTPLLETPQSISVVTRQQMDAQNVQSVTEALRYVPGVKVETFGMDPKGYDWLYIRGFNAQASNDFRDGLRQLNNSYSFFRTEPYALERIDILRGPASTLFGSGEAGGLINRVSKKPTAAGVHEVELQAGNHDRVQGQFDIGDRVDDEGRYLYRVIGVARDSNTQFEYGDGHEVPDDRLYLAPSFTWNFSDDTQLTLLADVLRDRSGGTVSYYTNNLHLTDTLLNEHSFNHFDQDQHSIGYEFQHRFNDALQFRQNLRYGQVDVKMNNMLPLGAVSDLVPALAGTPLGSFVARQPRRWDEHLDAFAVDNQLQFEIATGALQHTLLGGIDYNRGHADVRRYYGPLTLAALQPYLLDPNNPQYGLDVPRPSTPAINYRETIEQLGYYLQDQIKFGDGWIVTAGGRYDDYQQERNDVLNPRSSADIQKHAFTGKLGVTYLTSFGLAPYASYSESFLPNPGIDRSGSSFDPSEGEQWEVGVKYQPTENILLTLAGFEITKTNVLTLDPLDRTFQVAQGEARSRGIELEAKARLDEHWDILASYTWLDTEITKSNSGDEGNETPNVPRNMASAWVNYSFNDGPLRDLTLGTGVRYVGSMYGDAANRVRLDDYTLVDAAASYQLTPQVSVGLNVQNLFDRDYTATCYGNEVDGCYPGVERTVIGRVSYSW